MSVQLIINLLIDTAYSWTRMFLALIVSILFSWATGIAAARNRTAERIIIPVLDVLQSIPILGFFPVVLLVFVYYFPAWVGVNLAVIFLIFTSMSWNIAFAVYESVLSIPKEYLDLVSMERLGFWRRLTDLYIPASWSKVAYNSVVSWSVALFYLITSEIFAVGTINYAVTNGIGVDLASFASQGLWNEYAVALGVFVFAVILTRVFFLGVFSTWSEKFKLIEEPRPIRKDPIYRFYSWVNDRAVSKVFSHTHIRRQNYRIQRPTQPNITKASREPKPSRRLLRIGSILLAIAVVALIVYWMLGALLSAGMTPAILVSKESEVLIALAYSFVRVWYVYVLAVAIGLPLGIVVGLHSKLYQTASPILQIISAVPATALLPPIAVFLAELPFGGEVTAAFVIFLGTIWYIIFNVLAGIRSVPSEIWEVAKLSGLKGWAFWRHVLIPASLPSFVTGSITGVGAAWNTLIVAEYFDISTANGGHLILSQVSYGVGKLINVATDTGDLLLLGLSILSMTVLVLIVNILVWRRLYKYTTGRFAYRR
jgi:NitT/TauT family transport system permease protein